MRSAFALALAAAVVAAAPASAQEPRTIVTGAQSTVAGAAGGWTTWSTIQTETVYARMLRAPDGTTRHVGSEWGFLDLGRDENGRVVMATRDCPAPGTTCRAALVDAETLERRVLPTAAGVRTLWVPSVAGTRVAYVDPRTRRRTVRRRVRGRVRRIRQESIGDVRIRDTVTGADRLLARGPYVSRPDRTYGGPHALDYDGTTVAVAWHVGPDSDEPGPRPRATWEIRAYGPDGRSRRVTSASIAPPAPGARRCFPQRLSPTVTPAGVVYAAAARNGWYTARWRNGRTTYGPSNLTAEGRPPAIFSAVVDGPRLVVAESAGFEGRSFAINEYPAGPFVATAPPVLPCRGS